MVQVVPFFPGLPLPEIREYALGGGGLLHIMDYTRRKGYLFHELKDRKWKGKLSFRYLKGPFKVC